MSLRRRLNRMEVDMEWLAHGAWLDRIEAFLDCSDQVKELVAHAPELRDKLDLLPDGTLKPPPWHWALKAWEEERASRAEPEVTNPLWVPG